jgi:chromosome segregation ATPase
MADDETFVFTLAEFGQMQNEKLMLKHENARLKKQNDQFQELARMHSDPLEYIESLREQVTTLTKELQRASQPTSPLGLIKDKVLEKAKQLRGELTQSDLELLSAITEGCEATEASEGPSQDTQSEITKLRVELRKAALTVESSTEKCRALEIALDSTLSSSTEKTKQYSELESQKEHLIYLLAAREEEINEARTQIKEKYSIECEKLELQSEYDKLQGKCKRLEEEISSLRGEGALTIKERLAEAEASSKSLRTELDQTQARLKTVGDEMHRVQISAEANSVELVTTKAQLVESQAKLETTQGRLRSLQTELDDARTEKQIIQKRSMHDMKDLKQELAKEKSSNADSKIEVERMRNEIRQLQAVQRTTARGKLDAAGSSEKVFVEELSNRVNELELELFNLRKIAASAEQTEHELAEQTRLNEELVDEIGKLQIELATYGAQVNELIRKGTLR